MIEHSVPVNMLTCSLLAEALTRRNFRQITRLIRASEQEDYRIPKVGKEIGVSAEALRTWVRQDEIDTEDRDGLTTEEKEELRRFRREVKTLRQEQEIL